MRAPALALLSLMLLLTGCDLLGGESAEAVTARREAEGKAVGSACRHAMRAIEDCYTLNPKAPKAAVFAGWREMDEYMRDNKLEGVTPTLARPAPKDAAKDEGGDAKGAEAKGADGKGADAKHAEGAKTTAESGKPKPTKTAKAARPADAHRTEEIIEKHE